MLNRIWGWIFLISILAGAISSATQGASVINAMAASLFDSAKLGVEISIGLIGALSLWLGLFQIAEAAGVVAFLARQTNPVLHRLTRKDQIELFYLPSYSPQLNPEERLNADLKQEMGKRVPVRTKAKLREAANEHMTMLEKTPERVMSYFQDRRVRYAA